MSESLEGGNTTVVTQNGVTVERHLDRKGDGIIVTLELSADVRGPAEVDLVDEFPAALSVEQTGFNVDHEPDEGNVSLERVTFHHVIENETETIVYAIRLSEPADDVTFEPPTIREVSLPGIPEPEVPEEAEGAPSDEEDPTEGAAGTSRGSQDPAVESGGGPPSNGTGPDETDGQPETVADGEGLPEGLSLGDLEERTGDDGGSDEGSDSAPSLDGLDVDDGEDGDRIESALESAETTDPGAAGPAGRGDTPSEPMANGGTPAPGTDPAADDRRGRDARGGSGDAGSGGSMPRSVKLRLDRLNARVEEFAAYAEALEEIIERHGTAPEILENIESDIASADERLEELRGELEALQSSHDADVSAVRDDVDSLSDRMDAARRELESEVAAVRGDVDELEDVTDEVDAVADEVDSVAGEVDAVAADVAAVENRLERQAADVERISDTVEGVAQDVSAVSQDVEAMRSEMEALRHDVDNLLRFREILADVFGGPVRRATEGAGAPAEELEDAARQGADRGHPEDRSREDGPSSPPTGPSS